MRAKRRTDRKGRSHKAERSVGILKLLRHLRPEGDELMAEQLSSVIIARLQERAGNAERRTDSSELEANSVGADEMLDGMPKSDDPAVREYLEGMNTPFAGMISNLVIGDGRQAKGLLGALGRMLG